MVIVDRTSNFGTFVNQGSHSLLHFTQTRGEGVNVRAQLLASLHHAGFKSAHFLGPCCKLGLHEVLQLSMHCICLLHIHLYSVHIHPLVDDIVLGH